MPFRSIATNNVSNTDLVVTAPSGLADGDILIAFAVSDNSGTTFTWPSGFADVTGTPVTCTADGQVLGVAIKLAASEGADYTLTASTQIIGGVAAFSSEASATPHKSSVNDVDTASASPQDMSSAAFASNTTVTCDLALIIGADTTASTDTTFGTPAGGFTVDADINETFRNVGFFHKNAQASGSNGVATSSVTYASGNAGYGAVMIALQNAGGGGGDTSSGEWKLATRDAVPVGWTPGRVILYQGLLVVPYLVTTPTRTIPGYRDWLLIDTDIVRT